MTTQMNRSHAFELIPKAETALDRDGHTFLIQNPYVADAVALARSILREAETA